MNECWKAVGWNGVRLAVPEDWLPAAVERRCLVFECNALPVMTLKWEPLHRRRTHLPEISRIRKGFPSSLRRTLREIALPETWRHALGGRFADEDIARASAFSWGGPKGGTGILLACRQTRRIFLLHFYQSKRSVQPTGSFDADRILASLNSGPENGRILWALFDFQAMVPDIFRLVRHRFVPGAFELWFESTGKNLRLCRWAPASVLLKHRSLGQFAAGRFDISHEAVTKGDRSDVLQAEWQHGRTSLWSRFPLTAVLCRPVFKRGRVWHLPECNKIYGAEIEARFAPGESDVEEVCRCLQCRPDAACRPAEKTEKRV